MSARPAPSLRAEVVREYSSLAADYDRRWARYNDISLHEALQALARLPGTTILDAGCGTGELLHRLRPLRPEATLIGIDLVPAMLDIARRRLRGQATLIRADAGLLPIRSGSVDILTCVSMLHYLPDQQGSLAGFSRALGPGGFLVLVDWCADFLSTRLMERLLPLLGHAHTRASGIERVRRMLRRCEFRDIRAHRFRASPAWGMMAIIARKA